jgi:ribosomal protein L37AE/L43A
MTFKDTGEKCTVCGEPITYLKALDVWVCTQCKHMSEEGIEVPAIRLSKRQADRFVELALSKKVLK